jgi:glycerol-3-phosphate dehydrogenase
VNLEQLASGPPLDLAIIGGGINGCGVAAEAAARGLRVGLFEAGDFGFGTTWRSTKLIHGGLRYLEHGDLRLVFESLRERGRLLHTRPHLVRPQRFVLPLVPWTRRPAWQLRIGLAAYDLLSIPRSVPRHRRLSRANALRLAPWLPRQARGAFTFYDARAVAPERLALEFALEAAATRAAVFNHAEVVKVETQGGRVSALEVQRDGRRCTVAARAVLNAAGPWVDAVNALVGQAGQPLLDLTRGSHIVFEPARDPGAEAAFSTAKSDGRVFFAVPQDGLLLVGTTDDRYDGPPGEVRPTARDVEYLLAEAQELLPGLRLERGQIRYAYAGLRPLQRVSGGPEAAISRRHEVVDHGRRGGPVGLYSVVGGKLSTYREIAHEVVGRLGSEGTRRRIRPARGGPTANSQQPAARPGPALEEVRAVLPSGLPERTARRLWMYGWAAGDVLRLGSSVLCEHSGAVVGEVVHAARSEMAATLSDVLMRRTGIAWAACRGRCCAQEAARLAGAELGWDEFERKAQLAAFEADVAYHLPEPSMLE